jgi:hypothetical protein
MSESMKKLLILILLLPLFLLSGCKQKPTGKTTEPGEKQPAATVPAGWLKYENTSHKFSFYYPPQWQMVPEIERDDLLTFMLELHDEGYFSLLVRVENNPDNLEALDWAVKQYLPQSQAKMKATYTPVPIGDYEFIKDSGPVAPAGIYFAYQICPGNAKAYLFIHQTDTNKEAEQKYLGEVEKILTTLKFAN